jgi:hypothetical protein
MFETAQAPHRRAKLLHEVGLAYVLQVELLPTPRLYSHMVRVRRLRRHLYTASSRRACR